MLRIFSAIALLGALTLPLLTSAAAMSPTHPVNVTTCDPAINHPAPRPFVPGYYPPGSYYWQDVYGYRYHQPPYERTASLAIDYTNQSKKPMKQIEFGLVANGRLVAEVRDVGTFSPGVEIQHVFGLNPNVFPLRTGLAKCVPLKIEFVDGSKWRNPRLPALRRELYG